ncbi:SDR family NAD(P)-dependent oxidoreductase [Bacillus aquiflavi]|uniref:SDR family NAD(P)-dependent oxidoreductase n=1 Tax=Bacillus aquiflavi TaxID=2672567 RepID=A0A6B3W192_9BACI|nr:SDR family NAD(P)-dependent oxidoreductase [Bacillus aquiflavi]MBA4537981.1 SDR family NAD(P)-dependent oxidoreductase [Bacillus aquiflavi]NEY82237.1 SDR family NAD(P)-dependent oxidoreductase [Bacillus aquiflavi]
MNMLVTGGTGFLGKRLARRLNDEGHAVTIIGRNEQIGKLLEKEGIYFYQADLADSGKIENACKKIDYVFHCGALSSPWGKYDEFYQANVLGTINVINACKKENVKRLIHVSTPSLYFYFNDRLDVKENDPLPSKFVNYYAETKYLAEQEIDRAFAKGLPVVTIRPRALFGPEDTTIIPRLIRANEKRFVPLINGGNILMDLTYVDNVVDALLLCIDSPKETLGKKYNITNGETVVFKDVLEKLFSTLQKPLKTKDISYSKVIKLAQFFEWTSKYILFGKEPILTKYSVSVLAKNQTLNIDAARKELGYNPRISIEEGIEQFVEWWVAELK